MSGQPPGQQGPRFTFHVPGELEGGVYANNLTIWHTGHEFTLDFGATMPAQVAQDEEGNQVVHVPVKVTARVKVPPTVLQDLLRAVSTNLGRYEEQFGPVRRPGVEDEPMYPPDFRVDEGDKDSDNGDESPEAE